jgi:uncharacterized protein with PIN domain
MNADGTAFACDAMLKGLARWLRASGHDAWWRYGVEDGELVRIARDGERILLTQDSGLMERSPIVSGEVPSLFIPRDLTVEEQLRLVFATFGLRRREPRCMKCGGALAAVSKESVRDEAPPRTFRWLDDFYRCARCGQLFWQGTHWGRVTRRLDEILPGL